jgi:cytochrome P450
MTATSYEATPYPFAAADRLAVHPKLAELRRDRQVLRVALPFGGDAWLVTRYEDVKTVLADPRFSTDIVGKDVPRPLPVVQYEASILTMDPPEHSRLRKLVAKAFTARRVELLRPRTQRIVDDLLDTMISAGAPADLAESLNWPLPITVICELLGVPFADRARFRQWTDFVLALTGDEQEIRGSRAQLNEYLAGLGAVRRSEPTDDLLGELVAARDGEGRLSEEELVNFGVTLLVAGHETTANTTGNFVYTLLANPSLWEALVADPSLVPSAVEELLRIIPLGASSSFARIAVEDLELGGQHIAAGDAVVVDMNSANQDISVFERADEIDFTRQDNQHIAFGHGVHHCLGAQLARMEMQVAISTLISRLPTLRLALPAEQVEWKTGRLIRGVRSLPVTW